MKTKICSKCGEDQSIDDFSKNKQRNDGLQNQCKSCTKEYRKKYPWKVTLHLIKQRCNNIKTLNILDMVGVGLNV